MSNLEAHAQKELQAAGLFDSDSDYAGELGKGVLELITVFSGQCHSGMSAELTIQLFEKLARFQSLSPEKAVS